MTFSAKSRTTVASVQEPAGTRDTEAPADALRVMVTSLHDPMIRAASSAAR